MTWARLMPSIDNVVEEERIDSEDEDEKSSLQIVKGALDSKFN